MESPYNLSNSISDLALTSNCTLTKGDNVVGLWRPSFTKVDQLLYIFGGGGLASTNLTTFNITTGKWKKINKVTGVPPTKRYGHTTCYYQDKLIVFGGINEFQEYCNELFIFDIVKKHWYRPEMEGKGVPARYFHTSNVFGDYMYVYGGFSRNSECTFVIDKLSILDLKTFAWTSTINVPSRYNHSATLIQSKLYIFAGKDEVGNTASDILSIDLDNQFKVSKINLDLGHILLKSQHFCEPFDDNLLVFGKVVDVTELSQSGQSPPLSNNPNSYAFADYSLFHLNLTELKFTMLPTRAQFHSGVWNYFTISTPNSTDNDKLDGELRSELIFLGNQDVDRPQPYDHFRDMVKLSVESLGLFKTVPSALAFNMEKLIEREDLADFSLQSIDQVQVRVHRAILTVRWPYFDQLVTSGMKDSHKDFLEIEASFPALKGFVHFLYTDYLPPDLPIDQIGELLRLAAFYLLPRLRQLCCSTMYTQLDKYNFHQAFHYAVASDEIGLIKFIGNFFLDHFAEILELQKLFELNPHELKLLFKFVPKNSKLSLDF